jgi:hypothetical protein
MRDAPRASRNGMVWVSLLERWVVGIATCSNGNFEMISRIVALESFVTFSMETGYWRNFVGGGG